MRSSRETILGLILEGIRNCDLVPADCFNPRHAVRAERTEEATELILCYECSAYQLYRGGRYVAGGSTRRSPASHLSDIWRRAGCPVVPEPVR